jgi:hypothetical protein
MAPAAKTDERSHPMDINLLGAYAVGKAADALVQLVEDLDRLQGRQGSDAGLHGLLLLCVHAVFSRPSRTASRIRVRRACHVRRSADVMQQRYR